MSRIPVMLNKDFLYFTLERGKENFYSQHKLIFSVLSFPLSIDFLSVFVHLHV